MPKGECYCGAVSYEASVQLQDVYVCHCSICRSATGSGRIAVSLVENEYFSWLSGQDSIRYWSKPGHDWHTQFCMICGSSLPGKNDENRMYIPVGTLKTGAESLRIKQHLFTDSKAQWEEID